MKRIGVILLALLLCAACAMAGAEIEPRGMTMTKAPLMSAPDAGADVRMVYLPGVRVTITAEAQGDYLPVTVGSEEGALSGYIRAEHLIVGEARIRQFRGIEAYYEIQNWTMHAEMNDSAPVVMEGVDSYICVLGETEDWVHTEVVSGHEHRVTTGFVRKPVGLKMQMRYAFTLATEPLPGEVTQEEAIEFAKACLVADGEMANGQPGVPVTREMLDDCQVYLRALHDYTDGSLRYVVSFIYTDRTFENGFPMPCAFVDMTIEGDQIVRYGYGNG